MLQAVQNVSKHLTWIARPGRDPKAGQLQDAVRILPGKEVPELVRADEEERIGEPILAALVRAQRINRVRVSFRVDFRTRQAGERELGELEALLERELGALVPRSDEHEHEALLEVEVLERGLGERHVTVVRRIEDAAVQACHSYSTSSSGFTPAARRASSGASPRTR